MCYGRDTLFQHDHRTCPVHKANTEAYKKAQRSTMGAFANIRETKVEDELSRLRNQAGKRDPGDQEGLDSQVGQGQGQGQGQEG